MLESRFNKVTGLYSATSLKEMTPTQVFSGEFYEILKNPFFTEHLQATTSVWQKKYFINKIVKNPLRKKRNKWKQLVRKTTTQTKQKLNHYLHQVFISFYYSRMSLFIFSLLPMIYWKHEFSEAMQSHSGLSTVENNFSPSVWKNSFFIYATVTTTLRD